MVNSPNHWLTLIGVITHHSLVMSGVFREIKKVAITEVVSGFTREVSNLRHMPCHMSYVSLKERSNGYRAW